MVVFIPCKVFLSNALSTSQRCRFASMPTEKKTGEALLALGRQLGCPAYTIDDQQRAILHVAAVFVNNFSNQLFQIGAGILEQEDLSFDLLRPLILETAAKVQEHAPREMQTGPARRGDLSTIESHLDYLKKGPGTGGIVPIIV